MKTRMLSKIGLRRSACWTLAVASVALGITLTSTPARAGGGCRGVPVTDARGTTVEIKDLCFLPTVLHVPIGQSVTWVNRDSAAHTVTGANTSFGTYNELATGASVSYRFSASGAYPYFCFLHPGMTGAIVVGDGNGPGAASTSTVELVGGGIQTGGGAARNAAVAAAATQPVQAAWLWLLVALSAVAGGVVGYLARARRRTPTGG